jgi:hypothetical protein
MLVFGCSPHSGPSLGAPTTGILARVVVRYAWVVKSEMKICPNVFGTRELTAVWAPVGLDWSSATVSLIVRPSTPPSAFCRSKRAAAPCSAPVKLAAAGPVRDVTRPTDTCWAVTPGALAPPDEDVAELLQAAVSATMSRLRLQAGRLRFMVALPRSSLNIAPVE